MGVGCVTDTVVDWVALPPVPVQVRVYVAFVVSDPVDCDPLKVLEPDQAPEAIQAVALVDNQDRVAPAPLATVLGLALNVTVAVAWGLTVTVVDWTAVPPAPVQVNTYVALADRGPVGCDPVGALVPDHAPEAVQEVASTDDQDRTEALPLAILLGEALSLTVGGVALTDTVADCAALPPGPVQVKV